LDTNKPEGFALIQSSRIFNQFTGLWEAMQIPENKGAIAFWEKVVENYIKGKFQKSEKVVLEPIPHPMLVLRFSSKALEHNAKESIK
jgi:predicted acetyltransferase